MPHHEVYLNHSQKIILLCPAELLHISSFNESYLHICVCFLLTELKNLPIAMQMMVANNITKNLFLPKHVWPMTKGALNTLIARSIYATFHRPVSAKTIDRSFIYQRISASNWWYAPACLCDTLSSLIHTAVVFVRPNMNFLVCIAKTPREWYQWCGLCLILRANSKGILESNKA